MKSAFTANLKKFGLPAIVLLAINFIYFYPSLAGKVMTQDDIANGVAITKEIEDYRASNDDEPLWTNGLFGGMPTFQLSTLYPNNWLGHVQKAFEYIGGYPDSIYVIATLMLGFYFLMLSFKVNPWVSAIGAIAFGFSAFFIISLSAGHVSKVRTASYIAPVVLGVILSYRKKWLAGFAITAVFLGLAIKSGHYQIAFYNAILVACIAVAYLVEAIKNKTIVDYLKSSVVLALAAGMAIGPNIGALWSTYAYTQETMRGGSSELSKKAEGKGGLDFDYAMSWSYGIGETFNLVVPNLMGGGAKQQYNGTETHATLTRIFQGQGMGKAAAEKQANLYSGSFMYWGDQTMVNGGYYVGAIAFFLFVLGLMFLTSTTRIWVILASILTLFMAWGINFESFNRFMFDNVPMFNKFRVPSMALVTMFFIVPFVGVIGLDKLMKGENSIQLKQKLKLAFYIAGGVTLALALVGPLLFEFSGLNDENLAKQGFDLNMLIGDRKSLLRSSAFTSFGYILAAAAVLWFYVDKKLKMVPALLILASLMTIDLWVFDRDQLGDEEYVTQREYDRQFAPTDADRIILKDEDIHYRVLNTQASLTGDGRTSYLHKSIGGYHGAKLMRYQDLVENQLAKNNMACFNMLNTKWYLAGEQGRAPQAIPNMQACGNAWPVDTIIWAANADQEMALLTDFDPDRQVIIDERYKDYIGNLQPSRAGTEVNLKSYDPKNMVYNAIVTGAERMIVFSEIFYRAPRQEWQAYINGEPVEHIRVNYLLRGLKVPVGTHEIVFKFEPETYIIGEKINLVFSILLLLTVVAAVYFEVFSKTKITTAQE